MSRVPDRHVADGRARCQAHRQPYRRVHGLRGPRHGQPQRRARRAGVVEVVQQLAKQFGLVPAGQRIHHLHAHRRVGILEMIQQLVEHTRLPPTGQYPNHRPTHGWIGVVETIQ